VACCVHCWSTAVITHKTAVNICTWYTVLFPQVFCDIDTLGSDCSPLLLFCNRPYVCCLRIASCHGERVESAVTYSDIGQQKKKSVTYFCWCILILHFRKFWSWCLDVCVVLEVAKYLSDFGFLWLILFVECIFYFLAANILLLCKLLAFMWLELKTELTPLLSSGMWYIHMFVVRLECDGVFLFHRKVSPFYLERILVFLSVLYVQRDML
jgi:hypothetical protein